MLTLLGFGPAAEELGALYDGICPAGDAVVYVNIAPTDTCTRVHVRVWVWTGDRCCLPLISDLLFLTSYF